MSNNINAEKQVNELEKAFADLREEVSQAVDVLQDYKKTTQKLPSDYFNSLNKIKDAQEQYNKAIASANGKLKEYAANKKEQERIDRSLLSTRAKLVQSTSKEAKELARLRFETQQQNKLTKESAILSSKLATEYQKLVVKMNQAGRAVQSLNAKKLQGKKLSNDEQKELKESTLLFNSYQKSVKGADASINRFQRNVGNYSSALGKSVFALRNFASAFGVFSAGFIALDIFQTIKEIDGLDKALQQVTQTTEGFSNAQLFLGQLAEEAGVEINSLQKAYTKFLAAARTTNLTLEETNDIFRQTAKAGAVLGLSTDDINGAFTALEQILSKGKVQAEEIRGQLGERLPGAFQILAKSMGLTTQELSKQLELGNVISDEVLPNFAKELEKTFGLGSVKKVNTLTASQNRLSNAWNDFIRSLDGSEGTLTNIFSYVINGLTSIVDAFSLLNESIDTFNKKISSDAVKNQTEYYQQLGDSANEFAKIDKQRAEESIKNIRAEIQQNEKILEKYKDKSFAYKIIRSEYNQANRELKRLNTNLATQEGRLRAAQIQLGEVTEVTKENTKSFSDNNKVRKNAEVVKKNSIKYFENIISKLEDEQSRLATNGKEWHKYQKQIEDTTDKINAFIASVEKVEIVKDIESFEEAWQNVQDILSTPFEVEGIDYDGILDGLEDWSKNYEKEQQKIADIHRYYANQRESIEHELSESLKDLAFSVVDSIFVNELNNLDEREAAAQSRADRALQFSQGNAEAEAEIQRQLNEEKERIEKERIKTEQKAFLFQQGFRAAEVAIDTIQTIAELKAQSAILASNPLTAPLASIPLAQIPLVIATGAVATGAILAQTLPAFKDGVRGFEGGLAIVGDGGKHEIIRTPDGKTYKTPKTDTLVNLPENTDVFKDQTNFDRELNDMLEFNGIFKESSKSSNVVIQQQNGISEQTYKNGVNTIVKTIKNQTGFVINVDENGFTKMVTNGGAKTKILNRKVHKKARRF